MKRMQRGLILGVLAATGVLTLSGCGTMPNTAWITIDSEPEGAKIYEEGVGFKGTTPLQLWWTLEEQHYAQGYLIGKPFTCIKEGYLPQKVQSKLEVDPKARPNPDDYTTGGKEFKYHQLFILEPDARVAREPATQRYDITTRQDDNPLDSALKFGSLMTIIKSLAPTPVR